MERFRSIFVTVLCIGFLETSDATVCDYSKQNNSNHFAHTYLWLANDLAARNGVFNNKYSKPFILTDHSMGDVWAGSVSGDQINPIQPGETVPSSILWFQILCQFASEADKSAGICTCYGYN